MKIAIFSTALPTVNSELDLAQDAHAILFRVKFNGRPPVYDNTLQSDAMADLENAMNGKINIAFTSPSGDSTSLIPGKKLLDMMEVYSTFGGRKVIFTCLNTSVLAGTVQWLAEFEIPLSNDGTLPLGNGSTVKVEFTEFTNQPVIGVPAQTSDAEIYLETIVLGDYARTVCKLDTIAVVPGTTANFSLIGKTVVVVPHDTSLLTLKRANGQVMEVKTEIFPSIARTQTPPHMLVDGFADFYENFVGFNAAPWDNGTIQMNASNEAYAITNVNVNL